MELLTHDDKNEINYLKGDIKDGQLRRLILIDGFNIMHHFKDITFQSSDIQDQRMCPLILIPLIYRLLECEFNVRVVLRNMPKESLVSDIYVLKELELNNLLLFPKEDGPELDDLLMLKLAKKYGAIILTKDYFRNHRGYEDVAERYTIEYAKESTGFLRDQQSSEILKTRLVYKYNILLNDFEHKVYAHENEDDDYVRVLKSQKEFSRISSAGATMFKLLSLYNYCYVRFCYGYGIPFDAAKFVKEFPIDWAEFSLAYNEYSEVVAKNRLPYEPVPKIVADISDVESWHSDYGFDDI